MASPDPGEARVEAFRDVVKRGQVTYIDGRPVDLFSASHVVALHDSLIPPAQKLYRELGVERMVDLAFDTLRRDLRTRTRRR